MKKLMVAMALLATGALFAMDNAGWLEKARACAASGSSLDSDETPEDGVYCLVLAEIEDSEKEVRARVGAAELEAKQVITAFVKGESVTAMKSLVRKSSTVSINGEKVTKSYKKFEKRVQTKVNAMMRGIKLVGQITVEEKSYVVCVTCEKVEDQTARLEEAQKQYGDKDVVLAVGEDKNLEMATQKALRSAVEQVLGTSVVGYDKFSKNKEFKKSLFSGTSGCVSKYRVVSESDVEAGKRVEVVAKVSQDELMKNYENFIKFLGNPPFYLEANSPFLASHFTDMFTSLGFTISTNPDEALYVIYCTGNFRKLMHPLEQDQPGTQLSLTFKVQEINGREVLISMTNDPRKSACFVGTDPERQQELCADKAFKQMKQPLHKKIHDMIGKLVGRKMEAAAKEATGDDDDD